MSQKTVLLVEDEDNIALALTHLIGRAGYALRRVATGNAALEALRVQDNLDKLNAVMEEG